MSTRERLVVALAELAGILRTYGVDHWADWLDGDRALVEAGDAEGPRHVLRAFGGMGSLNDVLIHPANGHPIADGMVTEVNRELDRLRGDVHDLAAALHR